MHDKDTEITLASSGNTTVKITQEAAPLGLSLAWDGEKIAPSTTSTETVDWKTATEVKIVKTPAADPTNPVILTKADGSANTNEFSVGTNKITLGDSPVTGDKFEVTIKYGDAAEETKSITK